MQNKSEKILLIILGVVIILIILGIIFILFMKSDDGNKTPDNSNGDPYVPVLKGTFEEKLKQCLDEDLYIDECGTVFSNKDALDVCESLESDQCYYRSALETSNPSICSQILDEELKGECTSGLGVYVSEDEI